MSILARKTNDSCPGLRIQIGVGIGIGISIEWVGVNGFRLSAIGANRFWKKPTNIAQMPTIPLPIPIPTPKKANWQCQ